MSLTLALVVSLNFPFDGILPISDEPLRNFFIGMPWLILHYVSKWKSNTPVLTGEDEKLLDDMYNTARRLEERALSELLGSTSSSIG